MSEGVDARLKAIQALMPVVQQKASLTSSLPKAQQRLSSEDASLTQALAFGVCRFYTRLNFLAEQLLERPFKSKDLDVHLLLLIGLYQLQEERVADYAAIDTCVEASKHLKKPWASNLINACLRRFQREKTDLTTLMEGKEIAATAHPQWLLKKIKKAYRQDWQAICAANNLQPPMTLRVNQRQTSRTAYLQQLEEQGIEATATPFSPWGITLAQPTHPANLPNFAEGFFSVQDEAAQLAPLVLAIQNGHKVLDACCAPGGKTAHLAETAAIQLTALDIDAQRLKRVDENLARLQVTAEVKCADAGDVQNWWDGEQYDRILLDAPCSATGVIRRHPDIKLLRRETDIAELAKLQQELLSKLWPLLKVGGKLLYATCSILPEENQHPLANFLYQTPNAKEVVIQADWGTKQRLGRQLFPQAQGHDGFFYCLIEKTES
ncbi:16S rRNA (cytosine(967)-C(5))-methyltransferase RsmB [Marinospirillum insulare]|uniref:16S rRNA (cytosine(967)-C(5))-methyltransferase n=1 Tax=Marinospirillum insulare TaxID=217169 RepID=A0ABQ5ZTF2_9GAMM|nr:16S rRNA (cytosine(967)-C(5))-methyltransferase RsmB [Marinospirillum insulare]GLR63259.1 ribosomal RNA small subunit methyltransferase B [Marinospirillum insulare]